MGAMMGRMRMCWWTERMEATEEWLGYQGACHEGPHSSSSISLAKEEADKGGHSGNLREMEVCGASGWIAWGSAGGDRKGPGGCVHCHHQTVDRGTGRTPASCLCRRLQWNLTQAEL